MVGRAKDLAPFDEAAIEEARAIGVR